MISHQWENPLNYFYLEVCWQGFPLVHNAPLCADLGYYYEGNDVAAGCSQLLHVLHAHDDVHGQYRATQRERIARFLPGLPDVTTSYAALLDSVVRHPAA